MGVAIDVLIVLAIGTGLAFMGAIVAALFIVWVVETFLVGT